MSRLTPTRENLIGKTITDVHKEAEGEPPQQSDCLTFTFSDGSELVVGSMSDRIDGNEYLGAVLTAPEPLTR